MPTVRRATPDEVAAWCLEAPGAREAALQAALERLTTTYAAAMERIVELERGAGAALRALESSQGNQESFRRTAREHLRTALRKPVPPALYQAEADARWWCPFCQSDAFARDVRQPDRCLRCARRLGAHRVRYD